MSILPDFMIEKHVKITPMAEGKKRPGVVASYGITSYGYDARIGYKFKVFKPTYCGVVDPANFDERNFDEIDLTPSRHEWLGPGIKHMAGQYVCQLCQQTCYDTEVFAQPCLTPPDHILVPPNSFALGETVETFEIPRDVLAVCVGKSTYARCGVVVNVTPLEPEWRGKVTVEISNTTPLPAKVYCGQGIMQVLFFRSDAVGESLLDCVRRLCGQRCQEASDSADMRNELSRIEELLHRDLGLSSCRRSYADKDGRYQGQEGLTLPRSEKE